MAFVQLDRELKVYIERVLKRAIQSKAPGSPLLNEIFRQWKRFAGIRTCNGDSQSMIEEFSKQMSKSLIQKMSDEWIAQLDDTQADF